VYDSRDRRVDALSMAGLGLGAPMLDPPFRIAQAAVQVGDFKLSDGGFGSLHRPRVAARPRGTPEQAQARRWTSESSTAWSASTSKWSVWRSGLSWSTAGGPFTQ
jgi:hypothetical protein